MRVALLSGPREEEEEEDDDDDDDEAQVACSQFVFQSHDRPSVIQLLGTF